MKTSPDNFLSQNRIRYDGSHFQGTPAEIVAGLTTLNATRTWDAETKSFTYNQYESPDFRAVGTNPNTFSAQWIAKERKAMEAIHAAVDTGDPEKVYVAVDVLSKIREVKGGSSYAPPSDFDIIAHGKNATGNVARQIVADRANLAADSDPSGYSTQMLAEMQWFDTKAGYDALVAYAAG